VHASTHNPSSAAHPALKNTYLEIRRNRAQNAAKDVSCNGVATDARKVHSQFTQPKHRRGLCHNAAATFGKERTRAPLGIGIRACEICQRSRLGMLGKKAA
jgi:hypothetical protein